MAIVNFGFGIWACIQMFPKKTTATHIYRKCRSKASSLDNFYLSLGTINAKIEVGFRYKIRQDVPDKYG